MAYLRYDWSDYAIGLKADGSVVTAKWFKENQCEEDDHGQADLDDWTEIAYIVTEWDHVGGVRQDGTLLLAGDIDDEHGADKVGHIRLFRNFDTLAQEYAMNARKGEYKAYLAGVDRKREEAFQSRKLAATEVYLLEKKRLQAEAEKEIDYNLQHKADLSSRCNALEIRRAGLGLFKGKEKAALSEQEALAKQTLDSLKKTIENEFPKMSMEEFMQQ